MRKKRMKLIIICLALILNIGFYAITLADVYNYTTIAFPGALRTGVYGMNDTGHIVGEYYDGSATHGFFYYSGNYTTLDYPGAIYLTSLESINSAGQFVGRYMVTVGNEHGFIYDGGNFNTIDYLNYNTALRGINDLGQIVGRASGGFLYENSAFTAIQGSNPRDINNAGQIVGENGLVGFIEDDTSFNTIEYPGGVFRTDAAGINDFGEIVGYYQIDQSSQRQGFLYDGNNFSTINYPNASYTFLRDINNSGQMIANIILNGQSLGALITPTVIPEPISSTLFIIGGATLGFRHWRKRK